MDNKTFIDVYQTESELLAKMDELKMDGYSEEDMYVVAKSEDDVSMVRGRTNVDVEAAGGWADRFMGFMSGTDPVRQALTNTGMSDAEADRYYQQVENGGLLLYVDRTYGSRYGTNSDVSAGTERAGAYDTDDETLGTTLNDRFDAPNTAATSPGTADPNLGGNMYTGTAGTTSGMNPIDDEYIPETDANDAALTNRTADTHLTGDQETLRLHEERLNIDKERVQTGEVHIEKDVIEEEQVIDVPVEREEVIVERRAVTDGDAAADTAFGDDTFDNDTIRVPITEERVEVTKKPVVSEEIVVEKRTVQDTETVRDTVRREEARVEGDESIDRDRDRL